MFSAQVATSTAASGADEYAVTVLVAASAEIRPTQVTCFASVALADRMEMGVAWSSAFRAGETIAAAGDFVSIDTAERGVYADHIVGGGHSTEPAATLGSDSAFFRHLAEGPLGCDHSGVRRAHGIRLSAPITKAPSILIGGGERAALVAAADREGGHKDKITERDTVGGRGLGRVVVHDQLLGGGWSGV